MKQKFILRLLSLLFITAFIYLAGCNRSPLPVTAPTLTPASAENQQNLPPTIPTILPAATFTAPLPVVTVESTITEPPAAQLTPTSKLPAAAAAAAATVVAQPSLDPTCLVGAWEVTNLAAALSSSQQGGLALDRVDGRAVYTFSEDGNLQLTYDQLSATLKGTVDGRKVTAVESLNGSALARYQVDVSAEQVILSNFGGTGIRVRMEINGQRLAESNLPAWQAFTANAGQPGAAVSSSRAAVDCGADAMILRAVDANQGTEVQLKRIQ